MVNQMKLVKAFLATTATSLSRSTFRLQTWSFQWSTTPFRINVCSLPRTKSGPTNNTYILLGLSLNCSLSSSPTAPLSYSQVLPLPLWDSMATWVKTVSHSYTDDTKAPTVWWPHSVVSCRCWTWQRKSSPQFRSGKIPLSIVMKRVKYPF